jgi:signal transduction histidine kinase
VRFQWRLKGLEADWVDGGNRRTVSYSFLQAGNYQFEVRACNNDGIWNQMGTSVALTVLPFFWQTRWFPIVVMLVLVVGTAVSVALVLRARHRRRLARLEVLRATEFERSRIARDLHDELGSGLTEVTMLAAAFPGANFSTDKLHQRLQLVGERAHEMVDALDEIVWAVDPGKDNLPALARYFVSYVEEYLKESNIACMVRLPMMFPSIPVSAEVRHQLFLAVREAVTNAVRHAQPGQIGFAIELDDSRQLKISITDNGCGFDPATVVTGNGLANLRSRLDSLGGHCEIIPKPGVGTTVTLTVVFPETNQNV